jgi:hypothetical protein
MKQEDEGYGYMIQFGAPPQQHARAPHRSPLIKGEIDADVLKQQLETETRHMRAAVRLSEAQLFMNGLKELRDALCFGQVQHGDTGTGERPPVKPIFSENNQEMLQHAYLNLYMRYANYLDTEVQHMGVKLPKDLHPHPGDQDGKKD